MGCTLKYVFPYGLGWVCDRTGVWYPIWDKAKCESECVGGGGPSPGPRPGPGPGPGPGPSPGPSPSPDSSRGGNLWIIVIGVLVLLVILWLVFK